MGGRSIGDWTHIADTLPEALRKVRELRRNVDRTFHPEFLQILSACGESICSPCGALRGEWARFGEHVEFADGECAICGKTKPIALASYWNWPQ
jgi:hypothetical protein